MGAEAQAKADLAAALAPWAGKTIVVKFGGNAMVSEDLKRAFAEDVVTLHNAGVGVVVTHGGGPQISAALAERGIQSEFRGGLRVTSAEAIEVVFDVLFHGVNRELASLIEQRGVSAVGMYGKTEGLFTAVRRGTVVDGVEVDLGRVGDVTAVQPAVIEAALRTGSVPVVTSIAPDAAGDLLNVNADSAAAAVAVAVKADALIVLTDVPGLYADWPNRDSLVPAISADALRALLPTLESGMIPKMSACLEAVDGEVPVAIIIDGREPHSVLHEVAGTGAGGTRVTLNGASE
ncbi:MAG TPA: acetylglutamate kinase [Candidatus Lumbricidophila sp.]|nr:acetylglutamate kinase [Candidatus Lumbricidophila sp.]